MLVDVYYILNINFYGKKRRFMMEGLQPKANKTMKQQLQKIQKAAQDLLITIGKLQFPKIVTHLTLMIQAPDSGKI